MPTSNIVAYLLGILFTVVLYLGVYFVHEDSLKPDAAYVALTYVCSEARIIPTKQFDDALDLAMVSHGAKVFLPEYITALEDVAKHNIKVVQLACHAL